MSQYLFHQVSHNKTLPSAKGYSHVRKSAWVIANVSSTTRNASLSCAAIIPSIAGPVTTERNIKDDLLVDEVRVDIAVSLEI